MLNEEIRAEIAKRLVILEDQVRAIYELLGNDNAECDHPENKRENLSTMGITRWRCTACGFEYERANERED